MRLLRLTIKYSILTVYRLYRSIMEFNVFAPSSTMSLVDRTRRPAARTEASSVVFHSQQPSVDSSRTSSATTSTLPSKTDENISHISNNSFPHISFIQPDADATYDSYGYVDMNMSAMDLSSERRGSMTVDGGGHVAEARKQQPWFSMCHCDRQFLAIKFFYFAFLGGLGVVLPYAAVFMKQLGLSAFQIGVISGVRPVIGFISGPLWGSVADHFRIRRVLMLISVAAWIGFFFGLYFIEPAEERDSCPEELTPHRHRLHVRAAPELPEQYDGNYSLTSNSNVDVDERSFRNSSDVDQALLRENLWWMYEPVGLYRVFIICLLVICGGEMFQAPTTALSDAATLELLGRERLHQYGAQRAWGPIGWAISSFIVGALLSSKRVERTVCGVNIVFTDYHLVSYVFIVIMLIALAAAFKIDFGDRSDSSQKENTPTKKNSSSKLKHSTLAVFKFFLNVHYGSWIITIFFVGICNGVIWGFLFWHLDNLGASQLLMGIDSLISCLFEFVAFFIVEHVVKYIGHMGIIYVGLFGYTIRFVAYAALVNPWWVIPADALQGITFSFIWVSVTSYTAVSIPVVSLATVQGIIHGVFFGLGNGLGHLIGGVMIGAYGAALTYYIFAAAAFVWLLAFFACQKFSKKPTNQFDYHDMDDEGGTTVSSGKIN